VRLVEWLRGKEIYHEGAKTTKGKPRAAEDKIKGW
jgi:hypothetical protein